jgi:3-keto-5-aminohexanoate cleavage enzyme
MKKKLIITIAPTGNVPTKKHNINVPVTVDEIVKDIKACQKLGASVAHIHVRDKDIMPTCDRDIFKEVIDKIKDENIDIIKQVSTGARGGENSKEWRSQMLDIPGIEMASLSTGSSNFPSAVNANSPELVEYLSKKMMENNIVPEIEVFDTAMLFQALYYQKKGIIKGPLHFNFVLDVKGSMPGTPKNLMFLVDNLPIDATWTVTAVGKSQVQLLTMAIAMGGNVRTGLEDVIKYDDNTLATNEMLVKRIVNIANAVGRDIANSSEAREILSL